MSSQNFAALQNIAGGDVQGACRMMFSVLIFPSAKDFEAEPEVKSNRLFDCEDEDSVVGLQRAKQSKAGKDQGRANPSRLEFRVDQSVAERGDTG